jgi:hypothetical protein
MRQFEQHQLCIETGLQANGLNLLRMLLRFALYDDRGCVTSSMLLINQGLESTP